MSTAVHGVSGRRATPRLLCEWLSPREEAAAREVVRRVRGRVPAQLRWALLFGSKARKQARPDSDIDILLIFQALPPDREPQASIAEEIAEGVAAESGVDVATWSVALCDLALGARTPMLVDALEDGVPLWPPHARPRALEFTPADALRCVRALHDRIAEGREEIGERLRDGAVEEAVRRSRDDIARLSIAVSLLQGRTRPRRARAVRIAAEQMERRGLFTVHRPVFAWAAASYGSEGRDEDRPIPPPPGGLAAAEALVRDLREFTGARAWELMVEVGV